MKFLLLYVWSFLLAAELIEPFFEVLT